MEAGGVNTDVFMTLDMEPDFKCHSSDTEIQTFQIQEEQIDDDDKKNMPAHQKPLCMGLNYRL